MRNRILFGAFVSGMVVMIFEMVGARMIGPYFGTSMYVWSSIIGVILASLSLGYHYGGILADKNGSIKEFASMFLKAAFLMLIVLIFKNNVLNFISSFINDIRIAAIVSGLVLFAAPSFFFGVISPYAIKLLINNVEDTGKISGNLYAISTLGSILGTFLGGFILVPVLGINVVLSLCIALMCLSAFLLLTSNLKSAAVLLLSASAFSVYSSSIEYSGSKSYLTSYSNITVYDTEDVNTKQAVRHMMIGNQLASSKFLNSDELATNYLNFYKFDKHINPNFTSTLMIGGAACSYPAWLLKNNKKVHIDIVEIDKKVIDIAHNDFDLPKDERLSFYYEDGRTFLNKNIKKYDIIYVDAFNSRYSLPFQLTTIEAIKKMHSSLNKDGAIIVNLISKLNNEQNHFMRAELATYKSVFENVNLFNAGNSSDENKALNFVIVASKQKMSLESKDGEIKSFCNTLITGIPSLEILTDEKAPVEYYMNKMFD